jgi:RNA polymerase-binding protein DksA
MSRSAGAIFSPAAGDLRGAFDAVFAGAAFRAVAFLGCDLDFVSSISISFGTSCRPRAPGWPGPPSILPWNYDIGRVAATCETPQGAGCRLRDSRIGPHAGSINACGAAPQPDAGSAASSGSLAMSHDLDPRQFDELKSSLHARARQLREEIRQTLLKSDAEQYAMIGDQVRDLEDDSFADLMVDVNLAEIDRDLQELRLVDAARSRMDDGTYGHCEGCGLPIDFARLQVAPFASRCFDCQSSFERTHFQNIGHTL